MSDTNMQNQQDTQDLSIPKTKKNTTGDAVETRSYTKNVHSNNTVDKALDLQEKLIRLEYEYEKVKKKADSEFQKGVEEGKSQFKSTFLQMKQKLTIKWFLIGFVLASFLFIFIF